MNIKNAEIRRVGDEQMIKSSHEDTLFFFFTELK